MSLRPRGTGASTAGGAPRALAVLVLLVLPLALRLVSIDHGAPENYLPDTHVVRSALGMARDRDLAPPVGKYSSYPNLLPYLLLPVYATQYVAGRVGGRWAGADEFGTAVLEHPASVHVPARVLVALLGVLTVWVVFRLAREVGLRRGAWVAAWLVATGCMHVHFSVQERPWVPMMLAFALCAWAAVRHERGGGARDLVLAAIAAGLAVSFHQAGAAAVLLVALAWALGPADWRGPDLRRRLQQGLACAGAFLVVALLLGHPYLLVHGTTPSGEVIGGEQTGSIAIGGQQFFYRFRAASAVHLAKSLLGYEPLLSVLLLPALVVSVVRPGARSVALFIAVWAAVFGTNYNDHVRYLLPVVVLGALPVAQLLDPLLARPRAVFILAPLLAVPLVLSLRLDALLGRDDTRAVAEARLETLAPGAVVALDRYGPEVALSRAALERLAEIRERTGGELYRRERHRLERLVAAGDTTSGLDAVPLADLFYSGTREGDYRVRPGLEVLGESPAEVLAALSVTHVLLVSRVPADAARHPLRAVLEAPLGEPLWSVDPSRDASPTRSARLPTELDFALGDLWSVERPGPWIALYELSR